MQGSIRTIVKGGTAGVVGTLTMSVFMVAAKRMGLMGQMPPEKITAKALDALGVDRSSTAQDVLALVAHLGFGAAAGAALGGLVEATRPPLPPIAQGLLFGTMIWAVSYKGWVPAFGIMPPPERDRPGRPESMLTAHWVYGVTTAVVLDRWVAHPAGESRVGKAGPSRTP